MYISKIEIDYFGKWEHETFTFHPNLQVVQGLNESGKTTIRRFIEQMLFDFKQKKNGVYPYQPLHTNTRGGRMWIEDEGLGSLIIERTAVGSQKKLVLKSTETGQALPESMLERILHELTLGEYHLLFGFNEEELQQNVFSNEEEMHRFLYSLSVMGHKGAYEESQRLLNDANKLYRPQAKKLELNERIDRLEELTNRLSQTKSENTLYEGYLRSIKELQHEEEELTIKLSKTQNRIDALEEKNTYFDALEEYRTIEGNNELPKEYDHSKAVEANHCLHSFEKEIEQTKEELKRTKAQVQALGEATEDTALEALYKKAQSVAAVEERAFELERELKTHSGNIGVQREGVQPFTEAELAKFDAMQRKNQPLMSMRTEIIIGLIGIIVMIVVGFLTNQVLVSVIIATGLGIAGGLFLQKNGQVISPKSKKENERIQQIFLDKGIELTLEEAKRFISRNEGRSVNDFLQKKEQWIQLKERLSAFKEETQDFWKKVEITAPATINQQLGIIRETWMTSQKRVAKTEQLLENIQIKQHQLAQLEQDTIGVREELLNRLQPLGITTIEAFRSQLPTLDQQVALSQKRAYIQKQVAIFSSEEKESLQRETLEEELQDEVFTKTQLESRRKEVRDQLVSLKTKAELLEEDEQVEALQMEVDFERFEAQEAMKDWATQVYAAKWIIKQLDEKIPTKVPLILEDASRIFSRLTRGQYTKIHLSDTQAQVQQENGQWMEAFYLSKGALDQLYIAIRFAFIFQLAKKMKIPVLIDDGFVNFDRERLSIMIELMKELSSVTQVFYFTTQVPTEISKENILKLSQRERG
ncbi:AAA family ATPase [uncultured Granulicatella sp.]|uniref:ATP-binding protein n=1 Tax=uncultured Granulicatella sp. TaxID=316089 RepID=UPI00262F94F4|nr:AAA family ATPase [uncultured Granulicatella sp.]